MSDKHYCDIKTPYKIYGSAVTVCREDDKGKLWVHNGEYESQVLFCPNCGFEAWNKRLDFEEQERIREEAEKERNQKVIKNDY